MVFGNAVLLDRVATIVPSHLTKRFQIAHYVILALRFAIGIIDAAIITVSVAENQSCVYVDNIAVSSTLNVPDFCHLVITNLFILVGPCVYIL
jgi:hypothetical protein